MRNRLQCLLAVLIVELPVAGCVAVSTVDTSDRPAIQGVLEAGDRILVTTTEDLRYELTVAEISDTEISATTANDSLITFRYEEISMLQVLDPKPALTALGLTGAFAVSAAIAAEYPAYFLASVLLFRE